jgi:hypothetical protein
MANPQKTFRLNTYLIVFTFAITLKKKTENIITHFVSANAAHMFQDAAKNMIL